MLLAIAFTSAGQGDKTDSLIQKADNKNIHGTCHYFWVLIIDCEACESLIRIGKQASERLIEKLGTPDKGIIAHLILSNIWTKGFLGSSSSHHYKEDSLVEYNYAGLTFYEGRNGVFAKQDDLIKNKNEWLLKIKEQNQPVKFRIRKNRVKELTPDRGREKAVPDL